MVQRKHICDRQEYLAGYYRRSNHRDHRTYPNDNDNGGGNDDDDDDDHYYYRTPQRDHRKSRNPESGHHRRNGREDHHPPTRDTARRFVISQSPTKLFSSSDWHATKKEHEKAAYSIRRRRWREFTVFRRSKWLFSPARQSGWGGGLRGTDPAVGKEAEKEPSRAPVVPVQTEAPALTAMFLYSFFATPVYFLSTSLNLFFCGN